jgi:xanthine dehydrogenase YagT iron-sulfur-binding subunit
MKLPSILPLQPGDPAPDGLLPGGARLSALRGRPVVLAFAPDDWNPGHAHQSALFAQLLQEFGEEIAFVDTAAEGWHSLDWRGTLAGQFGVIGQRALFLLDEQGLIRWSAIVEAGTTIRAGQMLAALETLKAPAAAPTVPAEAAGGVSRRTFVTALLATVALLLLPGTDMAAATPAPADASDSPAAPADTVPVTLRINGKTHRLQLEPRVALLDALRENLHLTGTKKGCDHGQCGACTVHLDGQSALSCLRLAVMSQGQEITTIEGLATGDMLHPMQTAFVKHDAFQCGYCTPGQIMAATALLQDKQQRSAVEIREAMSGNLCRCAAYPNIIAAIEDAQRA